MGETAKGELLIEALMQAEEGRGKMLSMQLLAEIRRGYPVRNLLRLIQSDNDWAAAEGAFILAESGGLAIDLIDELPSLVGHRNMRVRYWAVDVLLFVAHPSQLASTCVGFRLLEDPDAIVRSYAIRQLARLPVSVLTKICEAAQQNLDHSRCARIGKALLYTSRDEMMEAMDDPDAALRSAGMSAAMRRGMLSNDLLERALNSGDDALHRIAEQEST
jgi:hypothetical protein